MDIEFRWNDWNVNHIAEHGIDPDAAELVVRRATPPYPKKIGEGKYLVIGRSGDQILQVIHVIDADGTLYVIHARPLNKQEKRRFRRREP